MQYIILILILMLLSDIYIWNIFIRGKAFIWNILYWIPFFTTLITLGLSFAGYYQHWIMRFLLVLILSIAAPKLIFALISLTGKAFVLLWPYAAVIANAAGVIAGIALLGASIYGFTKGWQRVIVREVTIVSEEIPASFDGYSIVQLSDMHIGTYKSSPETVEQIVKQVNALQPDAIAFTGDLVNSSPDELNTFMEILPRLKAKDGVFSVLGNHDYCLYQHYDTPDEQKKNMKELIRREREFGWKLLLNEHEVIKRGTDSIAIVGVENDGTPPFPEKGDLPRATRGLPSGIYKILLSHDPSHWRRKVLPETDIQLTLSGHTHAMQLKLGNFSPAKWSYPEWGGIYQEGNRKLYVSMGTGSNIPFRWGAWPEIVVIRLRALN